MSTSTQDCSQCAVIAAPDPARVVYEDAEWLSQQALEKPGWMMLSAKEHVIGEWGMTDAQATSFGVAVRAVSGAIKEVTGADRVYIFFLGENCLHYHVALVPLRPGESPILNNKQMEVTASTTGDPDRAREVATAIRALLDTTREPAGEVLTKGR